MSRLRIVQPPHSHVDPAKVASPLALESTSAFSALLSPSAFDALLAANDCSKSWMISSICSVPTEIRMRSSVTPESFFSSSLSCSCVVLHGWMAKVLESPTLRDDQPSIRRCSWVKKRNRLLGKVGNQLKIVHNLAACLATSLDAKR